MVYYRSTNKDTKEWFDNIEMNWTDWFTLDMKKHDNIHFNFYESEYKIHNKIYTTFSTEFKEAFDKEKMWAMLK